MEEGFDLTLTFVHLGLDATATPVEHFEWSASFLAGYEQRFAADGPEGRLVCVSAQDETWAHWERHPAGEELVVLLSGRVDLVQERDGVEVTVALRAGTAAINPRGVWHRSVVHEPGMALFVTPGVGTEHRAVERDADG